MYYIIYDHVIIYCITQYRTHTLRIVSEAVNSVILFPIMELYRIIATIPVKTLVVHMIMLIAYHYIRSLSSFSYIYFSGLLEDNTCYIL